jgi:glycine cleavage system aminomethyltransferase T/glycine/D-amino acid oxidase-like deaminating enzyme
VTAASPLPQRAEVVIVGGGITGVSVAYHLARAGWRDVLLLDKGELTSGSTHHAAGLVTELNPSATMMRFRRYSIELYRDLDVFHRVGSVRIASSPDRLKALQRAVSQAEALGQTATLISPQEVLERLPVAGSAALYGGVWMPGDGYVDPHIATHALASVARELGVMITTRVRATGVELGAGRVLRALHTDQGRVETEQLVNAAGIWAPQLAALAGAWFPSIPVEHQHVLMQAVPGHELERDTPCFRDPDNLVYGKGEAGGLLIGGYEGDPRARWIDGVPWSHGAGPVESDMDRFAPLLEGAIRRFPFLERAGVIRLLCHPDAMTPDGNPLLGPLPGTRGLWVAAGLSLNGFGAAGGIGRALAEWMTGGRAQLDVSAYRAWRFGSLYRDEAFASAAAREAYRYYYRLRYPLDTHEWGRGRRTSALHARQQELGAVFGAKNGWERPDHLEPGGRWRRSGADQHAFGWNRPPWFAHVAAEHAAFRERAGIIDLSSFGKLELCGPGALALLERVCDSRIDVAPGRLVYTQFLDRAGGIVADLTVTRLARERFRVITGAGTVDAEHGWLTLAQRRGDAPVQITDRSEQLATIGLWGPRARDVLAACTDEDVSGRGLPFAHARSLSIGAAPVLAQRISYVGELGYELYVDPGWAVAVWDALMAAGAAHGITAGGYRALDSLRLEKGYRAFGSDLTASDTPYEGGVGFCVHLDKGDFIGREALSAPGMTSPARRLRTVTVGGEDYLPLYGGEAVRHRGKTVGRVRSCAYGHTVRRTVALCSLPADLDAGSELSVEVFAGHEPAQVQPDALYDPGQRRMRA